MKRGTAFILALGLFFSQGAEVAAVYGAGEQVQNSAVYQAGTSVSTNQVADTYEETRSETAEEPEEMPPEQKTEETAGESENGFTKETAGEAESGSVTEAGNTESDSADATAVDTVSGNSALTDQAGATIELNAAGYTVNGTQITVEATNNTDVSRALFNALIEARDMATDEAPVTVVLPKGNYKLSLVLHIYSNTTLDLSGSTLNYAASESRNMLLLGTNNEYKGYSNYNNSEGSSGYNGFKNVTIKNGTFASVDSNTATVMHLAHATNVTLEGLTFTGGGCTHQVEVAAIDGFYVRNCTFKDFGENSKDEKWEALQLDIPCAKSVFPNAYQDGTPMKNVEITGCTFSNVPRGLGTHTMINGAYHENVTIANNTFVNVEEEAIVGLNYYNCKITNNTITDCGAGILFQYFKTPQKTVYTTVFEGTKAYNGQVRHDAKTEISGNNIKVNYSQYCDEVQGIKIFGVVLEKASKGGDGKTVPAGDYYVSGVNIVNNTITTAGFGIHLVDAHDCLVKNNIITGKNYSSKDEKKGKYDGIFIDVSSKNVTVENNRIKSPSRTGIFVQRNSYVSNITGNTISSCGSKGINFYDNSGCSGDINGNVISDCGDSGMLISTNSETGAITNNKITTDIGATGITVYENSKVKEITNNQFKDIKGTVISITTKSTVTGKIAANKITNGGSHGIFVYQNSKVGGLIEKNTLTNVKSNGIHVSNTKKAVNISGNKFSKVSCAIYMSTGTKGGIYANTYGKKVKKKLNLSGTSTTNSTKKVSVKSVKSSAKKKATVKWKAVSGVSGYEVQYSTDKTFATGLKTKNVKAKATSVTLKSLKSKKTYYVRVCSYKTVKGIKVYSSFSKVKKVKVK